MNVIHGIEAVPEEIQYIHELEAERDAVGVAAHTVATIVHAMQAASELDDFRAGLASFDAVLDSVISTANEAHWAVDGANGYEEFRATAERDSDARVELLHVSQFWKSVDRDATCLETRAKQGSESGAIEDLSATALWSEGVPIWASRSWAEFKNALPAAERWEVWTDWYEARLLGRRTDFGQELGWIAVAGKEWTAGAANANAAIEKLTDFGESRSTRRITAMAERNDYQVALSFAGEQRDYVEEVARHLAAKSIAVFYDGFEVAQLWGKDGAETFHQVYSARATYVVMFISEEYVGKHWARLERRSALSRMLKDEQEFILPVRFDDTPIPGLPDTTLYLSANDYQPGKLAAVIAKKLGIAVFAGKASDVPAPRMTSPVGEAKFDYSSYNGRYLLGSGVAEFETKWSKKGKTAIYLVNDPASIHGIAIDRDASAIYQVGSASTLDYTSRVRSPAVGQVVVLCNVNGLYAAVQVLNIKNESRGDDCDELHFRYAIQSDGTDDFEGFRDLLE